MRRFDSVMLVLILTLSLSAALTTGCNKSAPVQEKPSYTPAQAQRGMELVEEWKCNFCHTPAINRGGRAVPDPSRLLSGHPSDEKVPEMSDMIMGSAEYMEFLDNLDNTVWASNDRLVFAANLTPDNETGIGTWTETQFIETMRSGRHMGLGRRILYPMPWQELAQLDDQELIAIFAYLHTIAPVKNQVTPPIVLFRGDGSGV